MNLKGFYSHVQLPSEVELAQSAYERDISYRDYCKELAENREKRREYRLVLKDLKYIGMLTNYWDSDNQVFVELGRKLPSGVIAPIRALSEEEIDDAFSIVQHHEEREPFDLANRLLYAMIQTQDRIGITDTVIPNSLDLVSSLNDLYFSRSNTNTVVTRKGQARRVVSNILPYQIASGIVSNPDFKQRVEARLEGFDILQMFNYFYDAKDHPFPIQSIQQCERYVPERSSRAVTAHFTEKNGKRLLELMNSVRDYANHICEDENFIDSVKEQQFVSWVSPIHHVSMIYACSLMGEEEVEPLFSMSMNQLENHTKEIRRKNVKSYKKFRKK